MTMQFLAIAASLGMSGLAFVYLLKKMKNDDCPS